MDITIDKKSGFCFGVVYAIEHAERELKTHKNLYCLGDIVHNSAEVKRLEKLGLITINHDEFKQLKNARVLIRAHGEPPETYRIAKENNITLIDASCPVVLNLQKKIKKAFHTKNSDNQEDNQIVIYGKHGHAEVVGLLGQTNNKGIVISDESDLDLIDYSKPVTIFSQTTKSKDGYKAVTEEIRKRIIKEQGEDKLNFKAHNTICGQVSSRDKELKAFAQEKDVIIFVSGKKSSNGKVLYNVCKKYNERSYFISDIDELQPEWCSKTDSIGICGATSTPSWLMEKVKNQIEKHKAES